MVRRLVPPPTLLWAALGRVALPNLPDTVIRIDGATLRADIGRPVAWRLTFRATTLVRAERVDGGRVAEWVERPTDRTFAIGTRDARRSLQLIDHRTERGLRSLMRRFGVLIASLAAAARSTGCFYGFAGGGLPPNIHTMAIVTFDNQTSSPDIPKELYDQMRKELQRRLGVRDAPQERADVAGARRHRSRTTPTFPSASARIRSRRRRRAGVCSSRSRSRSSISRTVTCSTRTRRCAKRPTTPSAPKQTVGSWRSRRSSRRSSKECKAIGEVAPRRGARWGACSSLLIAGRGGLLRRQHRSSLLALSTSTRTTCNQEVRFACAHIERSDPDHLRAAVDSLGLPEERQADLDSAHRQRDRHRGGLRRAHRVADVRARRSFPSARRGPL